jgi:hypothetical protein
MLKLRLKREKTLSEEYEKLDIKSETVDLSRKEKDRLKKVARELSNIWKIEETKAR